MTRPAAFFMIVAFSLHYSAGLRVFCGPSLPLLRFATTEEAFLSTQDGGYVTTESIVHLALF